jgi:hypothetical protein
MRPSDEKLLNNELIEKVSLKKEKLMNLGKEKTK